LPKKLWGLLALRMGGGECLRIKIHEGLVVTLAVMEGKGPGIGTNGVVDAEGGHG